MNRESYDEGYKKGKNWKHNYVPGGPFACDAESREERKVWLEGFHDGLEVNRYKKTDNVKELLSSLSK